jgi:hypothetical protein
MRAAHRLFTAMSFAVLVFEPWIPAPGEPEVALHDVSDDGTSQIRTTQSDTITRFSDECHGY